MLTLPNFLTLLRIIAIPVFLVLLTRGNYAGAFMLFLAAGITDTVDGALARLTDSDSELGALLDPMADKLLLLSCFIVLGMSGRIASWLVVLVVSRDVIVVLGYWVIFFVHNETDGGRSEPPGQGQHLLRALHRRLRADGAGPAGPAAGRHQRRPAGGDGLHDGRLRRPVRLPRLALASEPRQCRRLGRSKARMRVRRVAVGIALVAAPWAVCWKAPAGAAADGSQALLAQVRKLNDTARKWTDRTQRLKLTIVDRRGSERQRELQMQTKQYGEDASRSLLFFLAPAEVRGVGFLQWLEPAAPTASGCICRRSNGCGRSPAPRSTRASSAPTSATRTWPSWPRSWTGASRRRRAS